MDRWEICFVDMLNHDVHYVTPQGLKRQKIRKDKEISDDSKDEATGRFVAALGQAGWELVSSGGGIRPILYLKRKLPEEQEPER
jgi:hypothetical protein